VTLWRQDLDGKQPIKLFQSYAYDIGTVTVSPDNKTVVFSLIVNNAFDTINPAISVDKNDPPLPRQHRSKGGLVSQAEPMGSDPLLANFSSSPASLFILILSRLPDSSRQNFDAHPQNEPRQGVSFSSLPIPTWLASQGRLPMVQRVSPYKLVHWLDFEQGKKEAE
jgi:hypothetical protein